jgi:hypothetical protein
MSKLPYKERYVPKNPSKYMGPNLSRIWYRSSWEHTMMMTLDNHPDVVAWQSEGMNIFYRNPFTQQTKPYVPDFIVVYRDRRTNKLMTEMIEVKPKDEMPGYQPRLRETVSRYKLAKQVLNQAKWQEAMKFCVRRGWVFRVACEDELFAMRRYNAR